MTDTPWQKWLERTLWIAAAFGAIWVVVDVASTIALRIGYPYDLEWMEGGMLHHAARIARGNGIYVEPSVAFIPYLYTPIYPALVGLFGSVVGITHALARGISVASIVIVVLGAWVHFRRYRLWREGIPLLAATPGSPAAATLRPTSWRPELWVATLATTAMYAAGYALTDGWYDLARVDSLALCMVTSACYGLVREPEEDSLPMRMVALTALLALAFFCKQTAAVYVVVIGFMLALTTPKRVWIMVPIATGIGVGGVLLLAGASDGWFWRYIFDLHRQHGFGWDRYWASFPNQLLAVWPLTVALAAGLLWAVVHAAVRSRRDTLRWLMGSAVVLGTGAVIDLRLVPPLAASALVLGNLVMSRHAELGVRLFWRWLTIYGASLVVGALGWGTPFAHFNAYMPSLLHGAIAFGALIIAALQSAHTWTSRLSHIGAVAAICLVTAWRHQPTARFIPSAQDRRASDALAHEIANLPGEVWIPSSPWLAKAAGKAPLVHRMGIIDVTARAGDAPEGMANERPSAPTYQIALLRDALRTHAFGALVLYDRDVHTDASTSDLIYQYYKPTRLIADLGPLPRMVSGAHIVPTSIWTPIPPTTGADDAAALGSFEAKDWGPWIAEGQAFGAGPMFRPKFGQALVVGYAGRQFASSAHGGATSTGTLRRAGVVLAGDRLSFLLAGSGHAEKLGVELIIDGVAVLRASPGADSSTMERVTWDVAAYRGKRATIAAYDRDSSGYLALDDIRIDDTVRLAATGRR